jgi:hypothetical protein
MSFLDIGQIEELPQSWIQEAVEELIAENEEITIHLSLKHTREVQDALANLENLFADEGGWWNDCSGTGTTIEIDLLLDSIAYDALSREEFIEFLGLEPEWVLDVYEV